MDSWISLYICTYGKKHIFLMLLRLLRIQMASPHKFRCSFLLWCQPKSISLFLLLPTPLICVSLMPGPKPSDCQGTSCPLLGPQEMALRKLLGIESSDNQLAKFVILHMFTPPFTTQKRRESTVDDCPCPIVGFSQNADAHLRGVVY